MFASLLRYRWLRELRAQWPWAAGLLLLTLAGQFALTSPRSSINLDSIGALKALPGQAIALRGLASDESLVTYTSGREGSLDLRFDQARLAPETLELLRRVGIVVADGDAPAAWITRAEPGIGAESMSRFEVTAVSSGRLPDALMLRVLPGATARQARLELVSPGSTTGRQPVPALDRRYPRAAQDTTSGRNRTGTSGNFADQAAGAGQRQMAGNYHSAQPAAPARRYAGIRGLFRA